jgi:hypothetical protein
VAQLLHDPDVLADRKRRVQSLTPNSPRQWGKMTVDQMLWHVNEALREVVDGKVLGDNRLPIPKPVIRWIVLNVPWTKGAPTHPSLIADMERRDFEAEKKDCLRLIDALARMDLKGQFPENGSFGNMSGVEWSRLMAKHLNHHLRQFGS